MKHVDKNSLKHFSACALLSLLGTYGVAFALGASLCKEWKDSKEKNNIGAGSTCCLTLSDVLLDLAFIASSLVSGFGSNVGKNHGKLPTFSITCTRFRHYGYT